MDVQVNKEKMWLSPEFLDWTAYTQVSFTDGNRERAYEIWSHSEQTLGQYGDDFHLVDAITTLKRSMSHRLQLLKTLYGFDAMPLTGIPKRTIEQLAFFGIVRPVMLSRLIDIRNAVEHEDSAPPDPGTCHELLDFVWYFLRSTDRLVAWQTTEIELESEPYTDGFDNCYELVLDFDPPRNWTPYFQGWVSPSMLSASKRDNWFEVQLDRMETRDEVRSHIQGDLSAHEHRYSDDLFIKGSVMGPENRMRTIFDLYFQLATIGN
jgi:hypothetical protein